MKKYFLHNGTESIGPFDLEELKNKKLTRTTPVWFEGLENWKSVGEIEELRSLLAVVPPPFNPQVTIPPVPKTKKKIQRTKILGLRKNVFFLVFGILVLIIVTSIFNIYQENRSEELERKNIQTEKNNRQFEIQQKKIEDQKNTIAEQEKMEAKRATEERKQTINNRLLEIKNTLAEDNNNLEDAKNKLEDASGFKFLRTTVERNEQVSTEL